MTPKTTPEAAVLAEYADLYKLLAERVPNCTVLQRKVETAVDISNTHTGIFVGPDIPQSRMAASLGMIADYAMLIRTGFSKYRDIVRQQRFWASVAAKACGNFIHWIPGPLI